LVTGDLESGKTDFFECCSDALHRLCAARRPPQAIIVLAVLLISLLSAGLTIVTVIHDKGSQESPQTAEIMAVPTLSISLPSTAYVSPGVPFTVYINVTDTDGDLLTITWNWGDGTANDTYQTTATNRTMVPRTHTWDPYIEPGTGGFSIPYTMTITVDDGTGNVVSGTRTIVVTVPENIGPYLYLSAPTLVDPMDNVTIVASATDNEGESLTWTFVFNDSVTDFLTIVNITPATAPNELVWNNESIVFGAPGNYTVAVSVSDALGVNQTGAHNNTQTLMIRAVANKVPFVTSITIEPSVLQVNDQKGYLVVNYSVEAQDPDGDPLNATWDFGDGSAPAYNESAGTTAIFEFKQQVNYTNPGTFNISVVVTDGRPGHDVLVYSMVSITSNNLPPSIVEFQANYSGKSAAMPNQTVNFTLIITDPELNTVEVMVDFGDNSTILYFNLTDYVNGNATITFSHIYTEVGNYTVKLSYTDNKIGIFNHSKEYNITIAVEIPYVPPKFHYSWWDYTSMFLFGMIPVAIAISYIRSRRTHREIEAKGMTVDEWKLYQEVMDESSKKLE
jgi:hypothetical protein